jgi:hypothetical protein
MEICETTITATSSNHAELLALHEVNRECVWLKSLIQQIKDNYGLSVKNGDISIQQIHLRENLADLFTKSLSSKFFKQLI